MGWWLRLIRVDYYQLLAIYKGLFTIKSKIVQSTSFYLLNIVELIVCGKIIKRIYRLHLYQNNQHLFIHSRVRVKLVVFRK